MYGLTFEDETVSNSKLSPWHLLAFI